MVREGRVLISVATDPDFASSYKVNVLEVGAQVTSASGGNSITVRAGHGMAANDKFILLSGSTFTTTMRTVDTAGATTITMTGGEVLTVAQGDFLINLANDTGSGTPNYDGTVQNAFADMAYSSWYTSNLVTTDSVGRFRYFYNNIPLWELIRDSSGTPVDLYLDTGVSGVAGPASSTDNAVVLWNGTGGAALKNSVVLINAGAVTGVTTLNASGAVTFGSTLAITGALSGVTTLNASGLITGAAGATIAGTSALGVITASSTLTVTGVATFNDAVSATSTVALGSTLSVTGDATFSARIVRSVNAAITASASPNNNQAGGAALSKDINNISTCATTGDAVTLPLAAAGLRVTVFNNGAASCNVYPNTNDIIAALGANNPSALAAQANATYVAFNSVNWEIE